MTAAPAAEAASPRVEARIVDRAGDVTGPRTVRLDPVRFRSGGRTCRVRAGSPLAALRELGVPFRARGECANVYVFRVGDQRGSGAQGWVYKVGRRLPSISASDPGARLRDGRRVTWFWCVRAGSCQRTLEASPSSRTVAPGRSLTVRVRSYDDFGRGRVQPGATVSLGASTAVTDAAGLATLTAPAAAGRFGLVARRDGMVLSFPERIVVG